MLIESLIQRTNGTEVEMDNPKKNYHFKPTEEDQRHIAEVSVQEHIKRFLSIREGFRAVNVDDLDDLDEDDDNPQIDADLNGSVIHSAQYEILGGDIITKDELIRMAFDDSGLEVDQWNALEDQDRYGFIDATLSELLGSKRDEDDTAEDEALKPVDADDDTTADANADADSGASADESSSEADEESEDESNNGADLNGNGINDNLEGMTLKQLEPLYVEKFGRKPSRSMRAEDIKRALSEKED